MSTTTPGMQLCFLVGAPRSGTTWIQRLLQSHPLICGGEESHFFTLFGAPLSAAEEMNAFDKKRRVGPLCYIGREDYEELFREIWARIFADLYAANPDCTVHLEKTPFHALQLDQIRRIFPRARIIFLVRDSRSTVASLVHAGRSWGRHWAPDSYYGAAIEWYRHVRAAHGWHLSNPDHPFLQVRYEDVVADTPKELDRMLRFLLPGADNPQTAETLSAFEAGRSVETDPEGFARKRGVDGWRTDLSLYGKYVTWRYTRKLMRELGYDISIFD